MAMEVTDCTFAEIIKLEKISYCLNLWDKGDNLDIKNLGGLNFLLGSSKYRLDMIKEVRIF